MTKPRTVEEWIAQRREDEGRYGAQYLLDAIERLVTLIPHTYCCDQAIMADETESCTCERDARILAALDGDHAA